MSQIQTWVERAGHYLLSPHLQKSEMRGRSVQHIGRGTALLGAIISSMRAVAIFAPLVTAAGLALGWYKKRGVLLNPWKREKYDKGEKTVPINTPFNCSFEAPKDKIRLVQAFNGQRMFLGLPAPKNLDDRGWLEWMKFDQPITGGNLLPSWLTYEEGDNELISSLGPNQKDLGLYTIRVYGSGEVILEEIRLKVGDQSEDGTELTARRAAKDPSQSMAPLLDDESTA